jgi:hypothetical protein
LVEKIIDEYVIYLKKKCILDAADAAQTCGLWVIVMYRV